MLGQGDTDVTTRVGAGLVGATYIVMIVVSTALGNVLQFDPVIEVVS